NDGMIVMLRPEAVPAKKEHGARAQKSESKKSERYGQGGVDPQTGKEGADEERAMAQIQCRDDDHWAEQDEFEGERCQRGIHEEREKQQESIRAEKYDDSRINRHGYRVQAGSGG